MGTTSSARSVAIARAGSAVARLSSHRTSSRKFAFPWPSRGLVIELIGSGPGRLLRWLQCELRCTVRSMEGKA
jgi:hypothetical protein